MVENYDALLLKRNEIKETIKRILNFPQKLNYDCMIPVSKIAFMEGKIVHTNEFLLLPEEVEVGENEEVLEEQGTWYSYSEAADILQQRVDHLDIKLKSLQSKSLRNKDSSLSEVFQAYDNIKETKPVPLPIPPPITKKILPVQEKIKKAVPVVHIEENEDEDEDIGDGGVFEIREFVDSNGQEINHEIVNLQKEMKDINEKMAHLKNNENEKK
mmetsp:Transcript_33965/g.32401  ORF Transcript_33965/g.32401 Transcript_33965/m.32401 type:complete len:214 (-) Transcript_33965:9-650(-)